MRRWVQQFLDHNNDTWQRLGENFEYILDHVDEWESGDYEFTDPPNYGPQFKAVSDACIQFGTQWPPAKPPVYAVVDDTGKFVGAYGARPNAERRADEISGGAIRECAVDDCDHEAFLDDLRGEGDLADDLATTLAALEENYPELVDGDYSPSALPHFDEQMRWVLSFCVLFGTLWELSHPSVFGVFEPDNTLYDIFGTEDAAEAALEETTGYVQRLSISDGDKRADAFHDFEELPPNP